MFVPNQYYLTAEQEKQEYDKHQNSLNDEGYLTFLSRAITPITESISPPAKGLDFGCGPAPALAHKLSSDGYEMSVYDHFYCAEPSVLEHQYDFITCTEVIEHLHQPLQILTQLLSMLKSGGRLVLMTKLVINKERFAAWHYKNDPTHICFYSQDTFSYLANEFDCELSFIGNDVIQLIKA